MKRKISIVLGVVIFLFGFFTPSEGQEKAAAREVVPKVQEAAKSLVVPFAKPCAFCFQSVPVGSATGYL